MPLSNPKIIGLLRHYFVPVLINFQRYQPGGDVSDEERDEFERLRHRVATATDLRFPPQRLAGHLGLNDSSFGVDPTYALIFDARQRPLDLITIDEIRQAQPTYAALKRAVARLHPPRGKPLRHASLSDASAPEPRGLAIHVTARYLGHTGLMMDDVLHAFPTEAWITFNERETDSLLPPRGAREGATWKLPSEVARKLFHEFYPPSEVSSPELTQVEAQSLTGRLEVMGETHALVRLEGAFRLRHPWWNAEDEKYVEASVVGFVEMDPRTRGIQWFRLVTYDASYCGAHGWRVPIGVVAAAVHSI